MERRGAHSRRPLRKSSLQQIRESCASETFVYVFCRLIFKRREEIRRRGKKRREEKRRKECSATD